MTATTDNRRRARAADHVPEVGKMVDVNPAPHASVPRAPSGRWAEFTAAPSHPVGRREEIMKLLFVIDQIGDGTDPSTPEEIEEDWRELVAGRSAPTAYMYQRYGRQADAILALGPSTLSAHPPGDGWREAAVRGHKLAVYLNRRSIGPLEGFQDDVFKAVQAYFAPPPSDAGRS